MAVVVFDSYAVLAFLFKESGAEEVKSVLRQAALADRPALITAVNWAEVLYRSEREQGAEGVKAAKQFERTMPVEVVAAERDLAERAAGYKANYKMSLANAFAAALAKTKKVELVTGDPDFRSVQGEIKIRWLK